MKVQFAEGNLGKESRDKGTVWMKKDGADVAQDESVMRRSSAGEGRWM